MRIHLILISFSLLILIWLLYESMALFSRVSLISLIFSSLSLCLATICSFIIIYYYFYRCFNSSISSCLSLSSSLFNWKCFSIFWSKSLFLKLARRIFWSSYFLKLAGLIAFTGESSMHSFSLYWETLMFVVEIFSYLERIEYLALLFSSSSFKI